MQHPAKFSSAILEQIIDLIPVGSLVLDPMAGTGKLLEIVPNSFGVEIEPEWALMHPRCLIGNALCLPFRDKFFDVSCTSPCYGTRMADHHDAKDGSKRITYKHLLGRDLHPENSGQLQYGKAYQDFHIQAWREVQRVTKDLFILNISDHVRKGKIIPVTEWHFNTLEDLGFTFLKEIQIDTPRMRYGQNREIRVDHESIGVFQI